MRKNPIKILLAVILLLIIPFSYSLAATTVTLDGVANAGYWADDLSSSYLNVKNLTDSSYYYQWRYGGTDTLRWNNMDDLVTDLNSQGFSWWLESGGDPFSNTSDPIWTSVYLQKGVYEVSLAQDSAAYNRMGYWGDDHWNAYVQMWTDYGDSFNYGEGSYTYYSEQDTLHFYNASVDGMTITLTEDTNLNLYINDFNSIDNSGGVRLNVSVVPEPGQVALFIAGALTLGIFRLNQKAKDHAKV